MQISTLLKLDSKKKNEPKTFQKCYLKMQITKNSHNFFANKISKLLIFRLGRYLEEGDIDS